MEGLSTSNFSTEAGWSVQVETSLYLVHGLLHLCGYDVKKSTAAAKMRRRQKSLLERFLKSTGAPKLRTRGRTATTSR